MWMGRRVQVGTKEWMERGEGRGWEGKKVRRERWMGRGERERVREYREAKGVEDGRGRK